MWPFSCVTFLFVMLLLCTRASPALDTKIMMIMNHLTMNQSRARKEFFSDHHLPIGGRSREGRNKQTLRHYYATMQAQDSSRQVRT